MVLKTRITILQSRMTIHFRLTWMRPVMIYLESSTTRRRRQMYRWTWGIHSTEADNTLAGSQVQSSSPAHHLLRKHPTRTPLFPFYIDFCQFFGSLCLFLFFLLMAPFGSFGMKNNGQWTRKRIPGDFWTLLGIVKRNNFARSK